MDGKTRLFDISDPFNPKQVYDYTPRVGMVSERTSPPLANWHKKGDDNEQYFKAFEWNGKEWVPSFSIDFNAEQLGRPHQMRFGAYSLCSAPTGRAQY